MRRLFQDGEAQIRQNGKGADALLSSAAGLLLLIAAQLLVGFLLSRQYHPTLDGAHASVQALRDGGGWGRFLLGFNYWGSAVLIAWSFLHLAISHWLGRYEPPNHWRWLASLAIFLCAFGFQATGNLLPMDQHDVQTVVVETGISAGVPGVGSLLRTAALGGPKFGQATLSEWNGLHALLLPEQRFSFSSPRAWLISARRMVRSTSGRPPCR